MTNKSILSRKTLKIAVIVAGTVALVCLLLLLAGLLNPAYALSPNTVSFVQTALANQHRIEADMLAYYKAGKYTFSSPLVVQNPYGTAPLTALLIFDTPESAQISIHVPGKTPQAAVDFTFPGYLQHHEIPIYGLYAGELNLVTVGMSTQAGASAKTQLSLQTEPLPVYLHNFQVDALDRDRYSPGFNFTLGDHKLVLDIDGAIRWYSTKASFTVFRPLANGHYLYTYGITGGQNDVVMEQDLLGRIYTIYNINDGVHHDIYELPSGNLLITSEDVKSATTEDFIIEVDRKSGHIVRSFDLKDYLDVYRPPEISIAKGDWLHLNSIVYDPTDSTIIISSRAQSAVIKMTYPGMKIQWILGPHDNWSAKYLPYLLTPVGSNFEWSWSQHDATLYSPDLPGDNIVDILLFDNGRNRSFDPDTALPPDKSYSRVVHYRIDQKAKTVEQVWEYGKERGSELFSNSLGSAYLLPNGDILGDWGNIVRDSQGKAQINQVTNETTVLTKIIEVDPSTNAVVFECSAVTTGIYYRAFRAGFYDGYSAANTHLSIQPNDTSGSDLYDRGVMLWRDAKPRLDADILSLRRFGRRILKAVHLK